MTPPPAPFRTEELLAQLGWVRAFARRVASDAHVAEDLTQDALLVALRGGRADALRSAAAAAEDRPALLRRWLAAVVRNLGRTRRRGDRRRSAREVAVAGDAPAPSTLELLERAATQRELVGALLEMDEPYRSTLLMRFFEGRTPQEIAERTGVPASTVGTRLAEGLGRLRRRFGGRESWLSSLVAFLPRPRNLVPSALIPGAALVSVQSKTILFALVLVGALVALRQLALDAPAAGSGPEVERPRDDVALVDPAGSSAQRLVAAREPPVVVSRPTGFRDIPEHAGVVFDDVSLRGRVIDLAGAAIGGVEVCAFRPQGWIEGANAPVLLPLPGCVTSDPTGRFESEAVLPFTLRVRDEFYATLFEGTAYPKRDAAAEEGRGEVLVVVGRRIPLGGVVVDEEGAAVADVRIAVRMQSPQLVIDTAEARMITPQAVSDEHGRFEFAEAVDLEGSTIQFQSAGFVALALPVPAGGDAGLTVVLVREAASEYTVAGHVVLGDGSPAAGAHVSAGIMTSKADAAGYFVIDLEPLIEARGGEEVPTVVTAVMPGLLPASRTLPSVAEARETGWPEELVLELRDAPLTLRGVVVDEEGNPLSGVLVEPDDMTDFGVVSEGDGPAFSGTWKTLEQLAGGAEARSGSDGRFELAGLLDRTYTLRALQRPSLLSAVSDPIRAGASNVRLVLDRRLLGALAGRIVDHHGVGVAGVRVSVSRKRVGELVIGASVLTDEAGAFRIPDVTTAPAFLRLEGDAIVPELFRELDEGDDPSELVLQVGRRCRVRFDWGSWPGADDRLFVVDERDEPITMMRVQGNSIGVRPSIAASRGPSEVLLVSDAAAHAIVRRADGEEVLRVPLSLTSDELNLVQL